MVRSSVCSALFLFCIPGVWGGGEKERVLGAKRHFCVNGAKKSIHIRLAAFSDAVFAMIVHSEGDTVTAGSTGMAAFKACTF